MEKWTYSRPGVMKTIKVDEEVWEKLQILKVKERKKRMADVVKELLEEKNV